VAVCRAIRFGEHYGRKSDIARDPKGADRIVKQRRSLKKRQPDCDPAARHLLAIIKPKIVRHTIILSADYLFLLTPPTSLTGRLSNPAVINLSIRSSRSLPGTFRVIFFFGVEHVRCILL
jgi:hypothetical protein